MRELSVGSLFSGIGGLDLGLERAGMSVAWQCEADPFCRDVLRKHWPDVPCYEDVRDVGAAVPPVDLVAGGFPCQPVSLAGRRQAQSDERWLWPEFARVVGALRPRYVLVENVPGLATAGLGDVLGALSALGYDAEWDVVSAAAVGAPHLRERIFLVAYAHGVALGQGWGRRGAPEAGESQPAATMADADGAGGGGPWGPGQAIYRPEAIERLGRRGGLRGGETWATESDVGRVAHGVPARLDRLRTLGNAVVPQVAEFVGRLILEAHEREAA